MTITIYGIKNCNTMKKAFDKLNELGKTYEFFDYKNEQLTLDKFGKFVAIFGDKVINKQGMTYRKLDDDAKAILNGDDVSAMRGWAFSCDCLVAALVGGLSSC